MKKQLRYVFLSLILAVFFSTELVAQTSYGSEAELKSQAAKLFDNDEFEEAYPLYAQLASLYNKDANFNFRLGVCMLYASEDKEKPIPFLELASKKSSVDKEVFFYLAKAYHLNYRFDEAIQQYYAYKNVASSQKIQKLQVDRQIEMCKNGKKLLRNVTDLVVIDKKEMNKSDFFRSYDLSDIGGKLLAKPDEDVFKTPLDKKKKESSIIYFSSDNNQIYFSSYGDDLSHGKDIYLIRKLPNGELSKPQTLGYPVNTEYDEDFPFLHPNGKVLYFCSKGHNSMGGYDIFKTTLNELTNTWTKPVNLDFPINSPDDDILYITNKNEREAYFSSARSSATGKIAVYHINVERKPIDLVIVNGVVIKNKPDQASNFKITVKDLSDDVILGIYNPKPETGDYTMNLPNGGKVMYTVEAPGMPTQSEIVTIPTQMASNSLKQEISFDAQTGKLSVKNSTDEVAAADNYKSALSLIKEKAKMDINTSDYTPDKNGGVDDSTVTALKQVKNKPTNLTNADIIKIAYSDAKDAEEEAKKLKVQANFALVSANEKSEEGLNKTREVAQLSAEVGQIKDSKENLLIQEKIRTADNELADINEETVATFNIAKALELKANAKQKEADLSLKYAKDLEAAVKSKSPKEALMKLDEQQKTIDAITHENDDSPTISTGLTLDAENKKQELDKAVQNGSDIKQEISDTEAAIASTETEFVTEKNDKIKQGLQDQIAGLKADVIESKKEQERNEVKVKRLQKEYNSINSQIELVNSFVNKVKTDDAEVAAATAATVDITKLEEQVNNLKKSDKSSDLAKDASLGKNKAEIHTANDQLEDIAIASQNETDSTQVNHEEKKAVALPTKTNSGIPNDKVIEVANAPINIAAETEQIDSVAIPQSNKEQPAALITAETVASTLKEINVKYEQQLLELNIVENENEIDKERAKSELYERWSTEIANDIKAKQRELIAAATFAEKEIIAKQIEAQEQVRSEKKELAKVSKTNSEVDASKQIAKNESTSVTEDTKKVIAVNTTDLHDEGTELLKENEQEYAQSITDAELETTERDKENKKLTAAKTFIKTVGIVVDLKKAALKSEKSAIKKDQLTQQIKQLETALNEKVKLANDSQVKIDQLVEATISEKEIVIDTASAIAKVNVSENKVVVDTINTIVVVNPPVITKAKEPAKPFVYENSSAKNSLEKAADLKEDAENTIAESNELKERALLQSDVTEKNRLYAKADDLKTNAETKKIEAMRLEGEANTTEYRVMQHAVDQYVNVAENSPSDELTIAELVKDDAKVYFEKAQNSRKAAASFNTYYAKQVALEDASKNEAIALEKQSEALVIYKNSYPNLFIKPLVISADEPPAVAKTTTKENTTVIASSDTTTALAAESITPVGEVLAKTSQRDTISNGIIEPLDSSNVLALNNKEKRLGTDTALQNNTATESKVIDRPIVKIESPVAEIKEQKEIEKIEIKKEPVVVKTEKTVLVQKPVPVAVSVPEKTKLKLLYLAPGEHFEKDGMPKYSASNRIPIDEKLPDGLIFKVQLGAFRNAIPQNLFRGISPISGETTPNGFIRYTAGLFLGCGSAESAKNQIIELGYKDAFIVAFFNGKRIPLPCGGSDEAVALLLLKKSSSALKGGSNTEGVGGKGASNRAVTKDLTVLSGLFYTVQVGVYTNAVAASKLFNIQPLYSEKTPNFIRYTVGIYNTIPIALEAKKIAMSVGLTDAFMTIYYNGKRISMAEAATLTAKGITTVSAAPDLNILPSFPREEAKKTLVTVNEKQKNEENKTPLAISTASVSETKPEEVSKELSTVITPQIKEVGVVYKIQIGAFKEEVPLAVANTFLRIAKKGIKNYTDENGLTIYTVGKYTSYEDADKSKQEVIAEGVLGAFVVAYSDGKKISIDEAQNILGK